MKRLIVILFCMILPGFTACIRDDLSNCPVPFNACLTFSYTGDTGDPAMFRKMIDHVTLMVFDDAGNRVVDRTIEKKDLLEFQGTRLYLGPGNYRAVCWGNADEHTEVTDCDSFTRGRLHHPHFVQAREIATNSHLYYGTFDFSVPEHGMAEGDIPFRGAHINVEIYIRSSMAGTDGYGIKVHNLMPQYDLRMHSMQPFATTYYPQMGYNAERVLDQCLFQSLRFADDNPVVIDILRPSGETLTIDLKEYMARQGLRVDGKNEATVPILFEFSDLGVVIKIPEWLSHIVTPGT